MFIKLIFRILIIFTIPTSVYSQLSYTESFPKEFQGIWSTDCESENEVFLITNNVSMFIMEDFAGLSVANTAKVEEWTSYKWVEADMTSYYFSKINTAGQLIEYQAPYNWDGIDYSFLDTDTPTSYLRCNAIPVQYQLQYGEIINLINSDIIPTCKYGNDSSKCVSKIFGFLDVSKDKELSTAELTRASRILIYFAFLNNKFDPEDREVGFTAYLTTSAVFPTLSKLLMGNFDYDNSGALSLKEIYTDRIVDLDYQNLFKENIQGLDAKEIKGFLEFFTQMIWGQLLK